MSLFSFFSYTGQQNMYNINSFYPAQCYNQVIFLLLLFYIAVYIKKKGNTF